MLQESSSIGPVFPHIISCNNTKKDLAHQVQIHVLLTTLSAEGILDITPQLVISLLSVHTSIRERQWFTILQKQII